MTREDLEHRTVWRAQGRGWRTFAYVWLPFTLAFLIATVFIDEVHWGTRIGAVCNVVAGLGFLVVARIRTTADARGLTVTLFRTRHIPWTEVVELRTDPPGRFATDVQAVLADGSAVTLPAVPDKDLPRVEELRSRSATAQDCDPP